MPTPCAVRREKNTLGLRAILPRKYPKEPLNFLIDTMYYCSNILLMSLKVAPENLKVIFSLAVRETAFLVPKKMK